MKMNVLTLIENNKPAITHSTDLNLNLQKLGVCHIYIINNIDDAQAAIEKLINLRYKGTDAKKISIKCLVEYADEFCDDFVWLYTNRHNQVLYKSFGNDYDFVNIGNNFYYYFVLASFQKTKPPLLFRREDFKPTKFGLVECDLF